MVGVAVYTRRPYLRLLAQVRPLTPVQAGQAALLVPWLRLVGDVAKMLGYPAGLLWRWRHRCPDKG
jgi:hypothetical protein